MNGVRPSGPKGAAGGTGGGDGTDDPSQSHHKQCKPLRPRLDLPLPLSEQRRASLRANIARLEAMQAPNFLQAGKRERLRGELQQRLDEVERERRKTRLLELVDHVLLAADMSPLEAKEKLSGITDRIISLRDPRHCMELLNHAAEQYHLMHPGYAGLEMKKVLRSLHHLIRPDTNDAQGASDGLIPCIGDQGRKPAQNADVEEKSLTGVLHALDILWQFEHLVNHPQTKEKFRALGFTFDDDIHVLRTLLSAAVPLRHLQKPHHRIAVTSFEECKAASLERKNAEIAAILRTKEGELREKQDALSDALKNDVPAPADVARERASVASLVTCVDRLGARLDYMRSRAAAHPAATATQSRNIISSILDIRETAFVATEEMLAGMRDILIRIRLQPEGRQHELLCQLSRECHRLPPLPMRHMATEVAEQITRLLDQAPRRSAAQMDEVKALLHVREALQHLDHALTVNSAAKDLLQRPSRGAGLLWAAVVDQGRSPQFIENHRAETRRSIQEEIDMVDLQLEQVQRMVRGDASISDGSAMALLTRQQRLEISLSRDKVKDIGSPRQVRIEWLKELDAVLACQARSLPDPKVVARELSRRLDYLKHRQQCIE